jgi:hypothetical protein
MIGLDPKLETLKMGTLCCPPPFAAVCLYFQCLKFGVQTIMSRFVP